MSDAIRATGGGGTAVVLGSGLLDDVPLDELATAFRRVVLVDAVHPWTARRRARGYANVERITADLSGSFALLLGQARDLQPGLPPVCAEPETALVISASLLSQLPIRPVERLENTARPLGRWKPGDGDALGRAIVLDHLDALGALDARICLVTDLDEREEDRDGRVLDRIDLLYGVRLDEPDQTWTWDLAPFGESARHRRLIHSVAGFSDWRP